jgi:ribosomal protein S18 acetylase RimI-like enzyme
MNIEPKPTVRQARPADAEKLAVLVNFAGEGLPLYLWGKLARSDTTAWEIGRQRGMRESGSFSYRNAVMIKQSGDSVGCLIGYEIEDEVEPVPDDMPAMFRPLQELENLAPGSWYINVLAIPQEYRGKGLGTHLLLLAEDIGRTSGRRLMSVIVSDANAGARCLYERCGYLQTASRRMVKEDWTNDGENWVLLTKRL